MPPFIYQQAIKKLAHIRATQKRPHLFTKKKTEIWQVQNQFLHVHRYISY